MSEERNEGVPEARDSEVGVVGACMLDAACVDAVTLEHGIRAQHFYDPTASALMALIVQMHAAGMPVDVFSLRREVLNKKMDVAPHALDEYVEKAVLSASLEYHCDVLRKKWQAREAIRIGRELARAAKDAEQPEEVLRKIPDEISAVVTSGKSQAIDNGAVLAESVEKWQEARRRRQSGEPRVLAGLPTPWAIMDALTSGWQPGLIILAGRPSAGKSTMEGQIAVHLATLGKPVARVALDMDPKFCLRRAVCERAGVSIAKLDKGFAGGVDLEKVLTASSFVEGLPMYLYNESFYLEDICLWAKTMKVRHDIALLTVDFCTLIRVRANTKYMNRNDEIGVITSRLKKLSFELGIPVLLLSQLSRSVEKEGREPKLSDLRDSGNIEQDAAMVWFLYQDAKMPWKRHDEYLVTRNVWVHLLKNQNGPIGALPFMLYDRYFRFVYSEDDWDDDCGKKRWQPDPEEYRGMKASEQLDMEDT